MELSPAQLNRFNEIHKDCAGFDKYSEDQKREIANGVANYYLTLFNIQQRTRNEAKIIKITNA